MIERKKEFPHVPINKELLKRIREADEDGFCGSPDTMARKKLKRKILLYDTNTKTTYGPYLDFDDLRVGDKFCLYEYNGDPVLLDDKYEVMVVREIKVRKNNRSDIVLNVDAYIN